MALSGPCTPEVAVCECVCVLTHECMIVGTGVSAAELLCAHGTAGLSVAWTAQIPCCAFSLVCVVFPLLALGTAPALTGPLLVPCGASVCRLSSACV